MPDKTFTLSEPIAFSATTGRSWNTFIVDDLVTSEPPSQLGYADAIRQLGAIPAYKGHGKELSIPVSGWAAKQFSKKPLAINSTAQFSEWLTKTQEAAFNNKTSPNRESEEDNNMKTIEFRVDEKHYSIEQEKGVISLKRIRQIAGLDEYALLYCWDDNVAGDGQFVPAAQSYIHNAEPNLFTEAYLSD